MELWPDSDPRGNLPIYLLGLMSDGEGPHELDDLELVAYEEGWDEGDVKLALMRMEAAGQVRLTPGGWVCVQK